MRLVAATMYPVGNNVVSLLGFPIREIPEFPDRRGAMVTFEAPLIDGPAVILTGTRTVFGLVMHRLYLPPGSRPVWVRWVISEPTTGCRVASGSTRLGALDDLACRVAFYGGVDAFRKLLEEAINNRPSDTNSREKKICRTS